MLPGKDVSSLRRQKKEGKEEGERKTGGKEGVRRKEGRKGRKPGQRACAGGSGSGLVRQKAVRFVPDNGEPRG